MTGALKPYPAYRDSGVPWLGEVPTHWEVRRLGQMGRLSKGNGGNKEDETLVGIPCVRYGDLYTTHSYFIEQTRSFVSKEAAKNYTPIAFGDALFATSGETIDEIGKSAVNLMRTAACCGGDVILFRPENDTVASYMGYALDCRSSATQKAAMGRGITVMHIYAGQLKRLLVPVPPLSEQVTIARYLDHVSERIDRYIGAKELLIALLNEKKQTIINRAVTRGLDPNAPMKPTGIDWMPEVPAHWETSRLKTCIADIVDMTGEREPGDIYIALEHVESWTGRIVDMDFDTTFESQVKRFQPDDVLFGKLRPYLAKSTRPDRNGVCVGEFLVLRPRNDNLLPAYLEILLRSKSIVDAIDASTFGAKMPRADWQFIGNMRFPVPPLSEQAAIVEQLERSTAAIDAATDRARRQIDLLHEYRERLINDVVTGRLDAHEARLDTAPDADALEDMERTPLPRAAASAPAIP